MSRLKGGYLFEGWAVIRGRRLFHSAMSRGQKKCGIRIAEVLTFVTNKELDKG